MCIRDRATPILSGLPSLFGDGSGGAPRTEKVIHRRDGMGLIWINEVSVSFGGPRLLDGATLQIEAGERIGLLGRNGSGKSTLMKLLVGDITPDSGGIIRSNDARITMLPQDVPDDLPGTVYDVCLLYTSDAADAPPRV